MVCLSKQYLFKFFEGCLPQLLLGPLLNTLSHIFPQLRKERSRDHQNCTEYAKWININCKFQITVLLKKKISIRKV